MNVINNQLYTDLNRKSLKGISLTKLKKKINLGSTEIRLLSKEVLNDTKRSHITHFKVEFKVSDANTGYCLVYKAHEIERSGSGPNLKFVRWCKYSRKFQLSNLLFKPFFLSKEPF